MTLLVTTPTRLLPGDPIADRALHAIRLLEQDEVIAFERQVGACCPRCCDILFGHRYWYALILRALHHQHRQSGDRRIGIGT